MSAPVKPFEFFDTQLPGVFVVEPRMFRDTRGLFVKTFHRDAFAEKGIAADFAEQFFSVSHREVLRGLHFQLPPHHHAKVVCCLRGSVFDVAVDLRVDSPQFGKHIALELSAENGKMLYIPPGLAHGFYALTEDATMLYNHTRVYAPQSDAGIRWDSVGIAWPGDAPVVSARDSAFQKFAEFQSPFRMDS
jgi:dTDP-4-dehydrorhamnose 3,5-epimerase